MGIYQLDDTRHVTEETAGGWFSPGTYYPVGYFEADDNYCYVGERHLAHHGCVFGDTGTGKTRAVTNLLYCQLKEGHSLVAFDPKETSVYTLLAVCEAAGVEPQNVHVVSPAFKDHVPGWNPLHSGAASLRLAVTQLADMAKELIGDWGSRLESIFKASLVILGTHGYGLGDLNQFLYDTPFRESLLARPHSDKAYEKAVLYMRTQFPDAVKADKNAVPSVLNKVDKLLDSDVLERLLTASESTLDLASFFDRQQVVIFHMSQSGLSTSGVKLLAGLVTKELFYLSERPPRGCKVILSMDEIGILKPFVEESLADIARLARESGLRLLVSGQELSVMTGTMATVLKQSEVQLFLRLNHEDAEIAAKALQGYQVPEDFEPIPYEISAILSEECPSSGLVKERTDARLAKTYPDRAWWIQATEWQRTKELERADKLARRRSELAIARSELSKARSELVKATDTWRYSFERGLTPQQQRQARQDKYELEVMVTELEKALPAREVREVGEGREPEVVRELDQWYRDEQEAAWGQSLQDRYDKALAAWMRQNPQSWVTVLTSLDKLTGEAGEMAVLIKGDVPCIVRALTVPDLTVSADYLSRLPRSPKPPQPKPPAEALPEEGIFTLDEDDDPTARPSSSTPSRPTSPPRRDDSL